MESEEELLKNSYKFYHAAVKELEEGTKEKSTVTRALQIHRNRKAHIKRT